MIRELPAGWAACTLGDLVERIETGKSVKCDERPPQGLENGLVKISAVTWGEFDEQESKTLFDSSHLKPEEKIQLGDFLISRANTLELVGSCVIVKKISKNLYLSDKVLRLVLPDEAKPWLLVCLRSQFGRKEIESSATGNQLSMRNISQQALRNVRMHLPPLAEQTRIAAKLDKLLTQVDTLKARIDAIPALLKRFRQSVLAAAVSGRLTKNIEGSDLPPGWQLVKFSTVVSDLRYGTAQKCDYNGGETGVLRIPNIGDNGIRLNDLKSSNFSPAETNKLSLKKGDILLIRSNGSVELVGKSAVVGSREEGLLFAGYLIRVRPNAEKAIAGYINYWLKSPAVRQIVEMTARSTSGVNNINSEEIKSLIFTMPPLPEQNEIVSRVEQLFAIADQLEAKVASAQNRIDRLTQSILAKAFRGELEPQDPNDEPASVLLVRIKAQRATAPKARRGRKAAQLS